jgi:hypothetical protein
MPLQGFDDASNSINKRGSARRKAAREANSKRIAERQAGKAKKKEGQAEFNKYATPWEKRKSARNGSVNKAEVIAKGKAAEQNKKPPTTQESLLNIKNEYVGFNPFKNANKSGDTNKGGDTKKRSKTDVVKANTKPSTEIKAPVVKTKSSASTDDAFAKAFKKSVAAKGGVRNLKSTPSKTKKGSYNFTEGTGPDTSVFDKKKKVAGKKTALEAPKKPRNLSDKTAARNYEKELRTYKRKTANPEEKAKTKVKARRRAPKGSLRATLRK